MAQNREHKIRKTDDGSNAPVPSVQDEKMELTAQNSNVESKTYEDGSKQSLSEIAASNNMVQKHLGESKQEEKMEVGSPEPSISLIDNNEDDNDIGEIHIVSTGFESSL